MHTARPPHAPRRLAALLVGIALALGPAVRASAEESENVWSLWWQGVTDRSLKAEIPIVFVVTIPAMIVVTPIWLVQQAFAKLSGDESGEGHDDEDDSDADS